MSLTLGEKLRQAREERGITITEVSEQTRISPLYLESIENDDFSPLPGGIFNKGFVKSFAKYVGVDENEALQDYARLITQQTGSEESLEPQTYKPEVLTDDRTSSSNLLTIVFAIVILGLMTWGILSLVSYIQDQQNQPAANANTAKSNTNANIANANTANVNAAQPMPSTDEIKVEFKTTERTGFGQLQDRRQRRDKTRYRRFAFKSGSKAIGVFFVCEITCVKCADYSQRQTDQTADRTRQSETDSNRNRDH